MYRLYIVVIYTFMILFMHLLVIMKVIKDARFMF